MKFLERPVNWVIIALLAGLVILTNYAVFQRYVVGRPIHYTEELSGLLLVWIVMIGAIAAERDGQHLSIDFIVDAMPPRVALVITTIISIVSVGVITYVGYLGLRLGQSVMARPTQILRISQGWTSFAVATGAAGIAFYMLIQALGNLKALIKGTDHE